MKRFKSYAIVWILLVILFNLCCFMTPDMINGVSKYSGGFWPCYGFVMLAFVLHLGFVYSLFSDKNKEKRRLNTQLTVISFYELVVMVVAGLVCILVPSIPSWIGAIICYAVLALSVIFLLTSKTVKENTDEANEVLNAKTSFMRELTDNARILLSLARTEDDKALINKVYEAIRYSDPVSSPELQAEEAQIFEDLKALKEALTNNAEAADLKQIADELLLAVEQRNLKCKAEK